MVLLLSVVLVEYPSARSCPLRSLAVHLHVLILVGLGCWEPRPFLLIPSCTISSECLCLGAAAEGGAAIVLPSSSSLDVFLLLVLCSGPHRHIPRHTPVGGHRPASPGAASLGEPPNSV